MIAGGQSLIPMLAFRLARPGRLLDINQIAELSGVTSDGTTVAVGATTRHRALERTTSDGPLGHLLQVAGPQIGHLPIRTRGTFGGSVAHSDAASEWCLVAALLDAEMTVTSAGADPDDRRGGLLPVPVHDRHGCRRAPACTSRCRRWTPAG